MSMFWSGDMILGCMIRGEDISYFKNKYIELNPDQFKVIEDTSVENLSREDALENLDDWIYCNEELTNGEKSFYAQYFTNDTFDGVFFQPANPDSTDYYQVTETIIFVQADKWLSTRCIFKEGFYNSFDELKKEFKEKIGRYLPDDFDYDKNIGDLNYACFA